MNVILLFLIIVVVGLAGIVSLIGTLDEYNSDTLRKKFRHSFCTCGIIFLLCVTWFILSCFAEPSIKKVDYYSITNVKYADGVSYQAFSYAPGKYVNVTEMYNKIYDDTKYRVKYTRYNNNYIGLHAVSEPHYFEIVEKD